MVTKSTIDFSYWSQMRVVPLGTAVLLTIGVDPAGLDLCDDQLGPFSSYSLDDLCFLYPGVEYHVLPCNLPPLRFEKEKLYNLALSTINFDPDLKSYDNPGLPAPPGMPCVNIGEFGCWVRRVGYQVPEDFPQSYVTSHKDSNGRVHIELPHENPFLSGLARIMFKHYSQLKADEEPNQKAVALEIDELAGWRNQKSKQRASSQAGKLAALIQPRRFQKKK